MRFKNSLQLLFKVSLVGLLFLVVTISASAQSTLTGRVFEYTTRIPIGGAKVENITTHAIVTTDTGGRFTIPASRRDLIVYSALSYKTDSVLVTSLNFKEVFLEATSKQLKDVNINSNNVGINKGAMATPIYVPPSPLGGQTLLYQTNSNGDANGGLKMMLGSKDKAQENRRKEAKLEANDKTEQQIKKLFSPDYLKKYVPLEGQELDNFILLYTPSVDVYRSSEFDFPLYVNNSYKEFMKMPAEKRQSKTLMNLNAAPPSN